MIKNPFNNIFLFFVFIFFSGCEEEKQQQIELFSVTTSNMNVASVYYNLISQLEVENSDIWHVGIVKDTSNYNMPSIHFGDVEVAVYSDLDFDNINNLTDTFLADIQSDHDVFGYGGSFEVLSYDITIHKVDVTNPEFVYLINLPNDNKSYKLQFVEYLSGITVFQYEELEG
tara:strand:- start:242 stop:757 length:516 start_codon:yes stop_codon:yes gene_type:complete